MLKKPIYTIALAGLCLAPDLPTRAKRVGGGLFRHYNHNTGRCDPGIELLMKALGMSRSTVLRALDDLCNGRDPYFTRIVHGGSYYTNFYMPNFEKLIAIAEEYDVTAGIKKPKPRIDQSHTVTPEQSHHVKPGPSHPVKPKPEERTNRKNHSNKTKEKKIETRKEAEALKVIEDIFKKTKPPPRREAMIQQTQKRLTQTIQNEGAFHLYEIDERIPGSWDKAIELEARKAGSGIEYLKAMQNNAR